jgi:uncharacterized coiled-coil DUF342 family protein
MDDKAFHEFLEYADRVVRGWPEWKQTCLGAQAKKQEPREPVDNFQHVADCLRTENKKLQQKNEELRKQLAQVVKERDAVREDYHRLEDTYILYANQLEVVRAEAKRLQAERNCLADKVSAAFNILEGCTY